MNLRIVEIKNETKAELDKILKEIETIKQELKVKEDKAFALQQALDWYDVASETKTLDADKKIVEKKEKHSRSKSLTCYDKEGNKKRRYASIKEAADDIGWTRMAFTKFIKQPKDIQIRDRNVYYIMN